MILKCKVSDLILIENTEVNIHVVDTTFMLMLN